MDAKTLLEVWLRQLMSDHQCQFSSVLKKRQCNVFIYDQLRRCTPLLQDRNDRPIAQMAYWLFNGIMSWNDYRVKCQTCNTPLDDPHHFKFSRPQQFCCRKCANSNIQQLKHSKQTRLVKNNGKFFSDESLDKAKQTFMRHYGYDNNMKSPKGRNEYMMSLKMKYGDEVCNVFQLESVKEKAYATKFTRYGDELYNNSAQAQQTVIEKSVDDQHYWERRLKKSSETCEKHYGADHPMHVNEIKLKAHHNQMKSSAGRYMFNNDMFITLPEFAFAVWCDSNDFKYKYEDDSAVMDFIDADGKQHTYIPDFHITEIYGMECDFIVEIKGDNHFKDRDPTQQMISFKGPAYDHIEQAKQALMTDQNVIMFTTSEYKMFIDFVKTTYGVKFIRDHKVCHPK